LHYIPALIPRNSTSQPNDRLLQTDDFENGQHRRADGDAGQECSGAVHYNAEFCAFFFGEGFDDDFNISFGESLFLPV